MPGQRRNDKANPITLEGDMVGTKIRGTTKEGNVEKVVAAQEEAEAEQHELKNPRKVLFTDDRGNLVAQHPNTLQLNDV